METPTTIPLPIKPFNSLFVDCKLQEAKPAFLTAVEALDSAGVAQAGGQLQALAEQLDAALHAHASRGELPEPLAQYLQGCMYDLYELQYAALQLSPPAEGGGEGGGGGEGAQASLALLSRLLTTLDAVCRGSELHVFVASALLRHAAAARGGDSAAAEAAAQLVELAHELRYGFGLEESLMLKLMDANRVLSEEFLP